MRNYLRTTIIIYIFFAGSQSMAQLANWKEFVAGTKFPTNLVGQINGMTRISEMKFHATDTNKMYAVTSQGGLFITTNQGNSWTVAPGTENLAFNCASVCVNYTNDQIILLGTGDPNYYSNGGGIYKSIDGGATFNVTGLTNCLVVDILQNPLLATEFVAATNKGMYKSTDGGQTWTPTTATTLQFVDLKQHAGINSQTLYACTRDNVSQFYRSTNFGSTWTQTTSGIVAAVKNITGGGRIGVTPADTNVVYFETIGGGGIVHKSNNGGLSFSVKKPEGLPYITFYNEMDSTSGSQGNYNNAICVDKNNPAILWLQSHNTMYSSDSGVTWTRLTHWASKVHTDMHQICQAPFNSAKLYSCNDGGVWLSTDGGNNWVPKTDGIYAFEIGNNTGVGSLVRKDFVSIGTQDNARLYGDATGWYTISGGDDYAKRQFDYNGHIYIDGTKRQMNHNGASLGYNLPSDNWTCFAFNRTNKDLGFVAMNDTIYRTNNLSSANPTWTMIQKLGSNIRAMHNAIGDANKLYVLLTNGDMHISYNALATTPSFVFSNLPGTASSIGSVVAIANNPNSVYVAENSAVYYSSDSGTTWTNIKYNLPTVNHRRILAEEIGGDSQLVFIATNNAVYYKKAGQTTWTNYSTNLPTRKAPTEFSMFDNGTNESRIRYATYGRGVWESPFSNLRPLKAQIIVTSDTTITCTNNAVTFADGSIGTVNAPITYKWSFVGGSPTTSNASSVNVVFPTTGTYTVQLTVTDGLGNSSSTSISKFIQVISCNADTVPGNALWIKGNSNYVKTAALPLGNTNNITLSAWIRIDTPQVSYAGIIFSPNGGATGLNFRNGNQLGYHWNDLASSYNYGGGATVPLGVWTHVALVVSPTSAKLYMNGVAATNTLAHNSINFTNGFNLGNDRNNASRTMDGQMDEVCIYNRALSQSEIRNLMHLTKNYGVPDTNLKAYYQANEIGNTVYNRAGGANATIQGNVLRVVSTVPVGSGVSEAMTVSSAGAKNFSTAGVSMSFTSGANPNGEVVVTRLNIQPDSFPLGTNFNKLAAKYWVVNNYGTNATFSGLSNSAFAGFENILPSDAAKPNGFKLYKRGSGDYKASSWSLNDSATAVTAGSSGDVVFGGSAITSFGQFTIFNNSTIALLPIQLASFAVKCVNRNSKIDWVTVAENNNQYFAIEYSYDGAGWMEAGRVNSLGNSNAPQAYQFDHANIASDKIYYRIKQVDFNGNASYSNSLYISCTTDISSAIFYPAVSGNTLYVYLQQQEAYKIYDIIGNLMYAGNETQLNTDKWSKGVYIIHFRNSQVKFLKE